MESKKITGFDNYEVTTNGDVINIKKNYNKWKQNLTRLH